jgi:hypothetical protein
MTRYIGQTFRPQQAQDSGMSATLMSVGFYYSISISSVRAIFHCNHSSPWHALKFGSVDIFPSYFSILKSRDTILYRSLRMNYKFSSVLNVGCK